MSFLSRTFFSATVSLPATTATKLGDLMRSSILHWGTNSDGTISQDSFMGSEASIVPGGTVYVGSDANVRDANATPLYKGAGVASNENYSLADPGMRGMIDMDTIWLYATGATDIELTFQGA